ncbi:MAG: hypothetical protein ACX94C_07890 [Phycisphaerales bacterium]
MTNYPFGVSASNIDALSGASEYTGDPEDATNNESTFEQWNEYIEPALDYDDEELLELYDEGKTPREVNERNEK